MEECGFAVVLPLARLRLSSGQFVRFLAGSMMWHVFSIHKIILVQSSSSAVLLLAVVQFMSGLPASLGRKSDFALSAVLDVERGLI